MSFLKYILHADLQSRASGVSSFHLMQTYTTGFDAVAPAVTTKDIVFLCEFIEGQLGVGYKVRPATVSEGGLEFTHWPDAPVPPPQEDRRYWDTHKSIRFRFPYESGEWPWLVEPESVRAEWKSGASRPIWSGGKCITYLKAFGRAPQWTKTELRAVRDGMLALGWECGPITEDIQLDYRAASGHV